MNHYLIDSYEVLVPPFSLEYDTWSSIKAEEYLEWYKAHIPERIKPETLTDI